MKFCIALALLALGSASPIAQTQPAGSGPEPDDCEAAAPPAGSGTQSRKSPASANFPARPSFSGSPFGGWRGSQGWGNPFSGSTRPNQNGQPTGTPPQNSPLPQQGGNSPPTPPTSGNQNPPSGDSTRPPRTRPSTRPSGGSGNTPTGGSTPPTQNPPSGGSGQNQTPPSGGSGQGSNTPPTGTNPSQGGGGTKSTGAGSAGDKEEALAIHNKERSEKNIDALTWDDSLSSDAQAWANKLASSGGDLQHSGTDGQGENLYYGYGDKAGFAAASQLFAGEKKNYNGQATGSGGPVVGHYTQMIWKTTKRVGMAYATASNGRVYVVARYQPPGNMVGRTPEQGS